MLTPKRSATRGFAAGLAGALVAGAVSVLAAVPAQASPEAGSLSWNISNQFVNHLSTRTLDGVTFDETAGEFNFPLDEVTTAGDGTTTTSFSGSVRGAFAMGGTEYYAVTVAEPTVEVAADGSGSVRATVSAANAAGMGNAAETTSPTEVTVAEFTGAATDNGRTSVTPNWEGVLPAGSAAAVALGITNPERPVDGKSFHPEFLGAVTSGVRAHFHSTSQGQDHKSPGLLQFGSVPTVTAVVNAERDAVTVTGKNFFGGDANRVGYYVGIAPSGGIPDTSKEPEDHVGGFIATMPVWDGDSPRTEFSLTLPINHDNPEVVVRPGVEYSVYTWQAHVHSSHDLDTEFPIGVLKDVVDSTTTVQVNRKPAKRQVTVTATVKGDNPTGRVTMALAGGQDKRSRTVALNANGVAKWTFNKLSNVGQYKVDVSYAGDDGNKASEAARNFKMPKIRTNARVVKLQHAKKARNFKQIRVRARVNNPVPGKTKGKVRIVIKQGKKNVRVVKGVKLNKNGAVNRVVKGLGKQINQKRQYRVVVQYQGTKRYQKSRAVQQFRLN